MEVRTPKQLKFSETAQKKWPNKRYTYFMMASGRER